MSDTTIDDIYSPQIMNNDTCMECGVNFKEAKSALYELMLSVIKETEDDPEIYWGNGQKIIENRLKELMK